MSESLDERLSDAFLEILQEENPNWVHQEQIYQWVENFVEFDKRQLELHIQKAGQIEPHWQHDLRNIQHKLKRKGMVINPSKEVWGLPVIDFQIDKYPRLWIDSINRSQNFDDIRRVDDTFVRNDTVVSRKLLEERFAHLIRSGGTLPLGRLHVWSERESILLDVLPVVVIEDGYITINEDVDMLKICGIKCAMSIPTFLAKVSGPEQRGALAIQNRKNDGQEKRTVAIRRIQRTQFDEIERRRVIDPRTGNNVHLNNAQPSYDYHCPICGERLRAHTTSRYMAPHWRHTGIAEERREHVLRTCPFYFSHLRNRDTFPENLQRGNLSGDERAQQRRNEHLLIQVRHLGRGQYQVETTSGDSMHGFPVLLGSRIEIQDPHGHLNPEDVDELVRWSEEQIGEARSVRIIEPTNEVDIGITIQNQRPTCLRCPGIESGNIFSIDSMEDLGVRGRGIRRIRPGLTYLENDDTITHIDTQMLGVIISVDEEELINQSNEIDPIDLRRIFENLVLVVLSTTDEDHLEFLRDNFNVDLDNQFEPTQQQKLSVIVRLPISSNPSGNKGTVNCSPENPMELLVKNTVMDEEGNFDWHDSVALIRTTYAEPEEQEILHDENGECRIVWGYQTTTTWCPCL